MDFKKFGNFNWIEMDSKDQNLDFTRIKRIHFCPFQSNFVCWTFIFWFIMRLLCNFLYTHCLPMITWSFRHVKKKHIKWFL